MTLEPTPTRGLVFSSFFELGNQRSEQPPENACEPKSIFKDVCKFGSTASGRSVAASLKVMATLDMLKNDAEDIAEFVTNGSHFLLF